MSTFEVKQYRKKLDMPQTPTAMTATSTPAASSGSCGGGGVGVHHEKNQPLTEEKMAEPSLSSTATTDISPLVHRPLPAHLAELLAAARTGQLPHGAVKLASGLVTDLEGYVLAWAECWPRDRAHVLRRLEEAHAATNTRMPRAEALLRLERPA